MPFFMGHALFEVGKTGVFYCSLLCYNYEIANNIMKILFSPNFKVIMYLFVFKFYPHGLRIRVYTQSFTLLRHVLLRHMIYFYKNSIMLSNSIYTRLQALIN